MNLSTREAYGLALARLGETYDFVVLDSDLAKATQTIKFKEKFPTRFFDMGIAECDMMSTAAGMATCGRKVLASTFAMFAAGRAFEQIRNAIACPGLDVVIGATHAGVLIGEDGGSHQCIEDISLMRTIPGMKVAVPCDEASVNGVLNAVMKEKGPIYIRMGRLSAKDIYEQTTNFTFGKGTVIKDGEDLAIFAIGDMVAEALSASQILETEGISVAVIDMASVKPLDEDLIRHYISKTHKIITAEDHSVIGGLGSAVSEVVAQVGNAKMRMVGVCDIFGTSGKKEALQKNYRLTAAEIVKKFREL